MNQSQYQDLIAASLRRALTPEEEAAVRAWAGNNAANRLELEEDLRLSQCLRELPDAPISSNFTALVMGQIEREPAAAEAVAGRWARWLPFAGLRYATAITIAALLAVFSYQQYASTARVARARQIAEVAALTGGVLDAFQGATAAGSANGGTTGAATIETLDDFEVIRTLSLVDRELLTNLPQQ